MPAARRISQTVDGATVTPSVVSSPCIRRCPRNGFSFASRTTRRAMPGAAGGRPGLRRLLMSYFFAASLRCQASSVAGVTGTTPVRRLRGRSLPSAANHTRSAGSYPIRLTCRGSTAFWCREHQQLSILRLVATAEQDDQAEYPARQQVDDLEQHPASQPSPRQACWQQRRSTTQSSIRAAQDHPPGAFR
jgi:hypothetical protein